MKPQPIWDVILVILVYILVCILVCVSPNEFVWPRHFHLNYYPSCRTQDSFAAVNMGNKSPNLKPSWNIHCPTDSRSQLWFCPPLKRKIDMFWMYQVAGRNFIWNGHYWAASAQILDFRQPPLKLRGGFLCDMGDRPSVIRETGPSSIVGHKEWNLFLLFVVVIVVCYCYF